jgi:D-alanyl-D-alanine carboxypeptidase/D-alanyl-D-alanine-endopeptidase (penicillin-binding protein 4)
VPPADGEDEEGDATPRWPGRDRDEPDAGPDPETGEPVPAAASPGWDDEPPRAAPARIEASEGAHSERPPKPRRRRAHRLAISGGGLLVVLVLAAAALIFVPGAAEKVGLSGIGTPETSPAPQPGSPHPRVVPLAADAPVPSRSGVAAALTERASDPSLGTLTGEVVDARSGRRLWSAEPGKPQAPGSTNKLLTAAAALLALNPDATLTTKVVAGSKPGTVIIVGGGDPTLSSLPEGKHSVYPDAAHLDELVKQLKKHARHRITEVAIDETRYSGPSKAPGWDTADIAAGNWAPIVPAMADGGREDPTGEDSPRSSNPAGALLEAVAHRLGARPAGREAAPPDARTLASVHSAPIHELVDTMLTISDNVLAEALGRRVAHAVGKPESFSGAVAAVRQVLTAHGFDYGGARLVDASGLSTSDRLPARLLAGVLRTTAAPVGANPATGRLRPILTGLPVAGGTGTLAAHDRFASGPAASGRGYVRAKTGTLSGVSDLAGVVVDQDGRLLAFAFMSTGSQISTARTGLDDMAASLRDCGCR